MASTAFPLAQQGLFSFSGSSFTGAVINQCSHVKAHEPVDVTGSRLSGGSFVQDKAKQWTQRLPVGDLVASGHVEKTKVYSHAQLSTLTLGTFVVHIGEWRLRKLWPLVDVTNGSAKEWTWGIPIYSLQARGWAKATTGPVTGTAQCSASFVADQIGTIAWATGTTNIMKVEEVRTDVPLFRGGGIPVAISGLFHGGVTYSAGTNTFAWLFINPETTADDPLRLTATLDTDAESISGPVLLYDHVFTCPSILGGPITYDLNMRFDGS